MLAKCTSATRRHRTRATEASGEPEAPARRYCARLQCPTSGPPPHPKHKVARRHSPVAAQAVAPLRSTPPVRRLRRRQRRPPCFRNKPLAASLPRQVVPFRAPHAATVHRLRTHRRCTSRLAPSRVPPAPGSRFPLDQRRQGAPTDTRPRLDTSTPSASHMPRSRDPRNAESRPLASATNRCPAHLHQRRGPALLWQAVPSADLAGTTKPMQLGHL
mmetsp:Transcript_123970/g.358526  ORF Transcript_123970/g.358526 Transcript_123970/m.358526 type:complete len:216 (-) Transcript_123970:860-1507(-)